LHLDNASIRLQFELPGIDTAGVPERFDHPHRPMATHSEYSYIIEEDHCGFAIGQRTLEQ
jgi:hypothetical protein